MNRNDMVAQKFTMPEEWRVTTLSFYAFGEVYLANKTQPANTTQPVNTTQQANVTQPQNQTRVLSPTQVWVQLRSTLDGPALAWGYVDVTGYGWYDVPLNQNWTLYKGCSYYFVALSWDYSWWLCYNNNGNPDDDGEALVKRSGGGWESMPWDFVVRYRGEYIINAARVQHLQDLAENRKPYIQHEVGETWFACDFYYDRDTDISNNPAHWGERYSHPDWDPDYRVFIHIEEYVFHDSIPLEEKPMIAIEYWYYYVYNDAWWPGGDHDHDFELHTIVFLDQENENVVRIVGFSHHITIGYRYPNEVEWIGTHPKAYVAYGTHAADNSREIPWDDEWRGDGILLSPSVFKNVFVLHTSPCRDHSTNYCKIVYNDCWHGYHFWWNNLDARDWWPREFPELGAPAPWHRYTWDEPTTGDSRV